MSPQRNWPSVAETEEETERRMRHLTSAMTAVNEIRQALKVVIDGIGEETLKQTIDPHTLLVAFVGVWAAAEAHALKITDRLGGEATKKRGQEILDLFQLVLMMFAATNPIPEKPKEPVTN